MKFKRILFFISIVFILIQSFTTTIYAESNKEFKFEKPTYSLRGEHDDAVVNVILPDGYTMKDVEIISENEDIVHVINFNDKYFIESLTIGETRLKATIKSTGYVTYCNVRVEEPIIINIFKKNVGATLDIDSYCPLLWSIDSRQACEISVMPLNDGQEEKWIRLGKEDIYRLCSK